MDNTFVVLIKQLWKLNIENHRHNSWKGSFNEKSTLTKKQGDAKALDCAAQRHQSFLGFLVQMTPRAPCGSNQ